MLYGRYLQKNIHELALARGKMAFISGPRQVGKTTLALFYKENVDQFIYKNWDETEFRRLWTKTPDLIANEFDLNRVHLKRLLVLDEIHKSKGWKQKLKGLYDTRKGDFNILVTGSARLNVFKKGGDSLMGRYLHFRLHPLSFGELENKLAPLDPENWRKNLFNLVPASSKNQKTVKKLLEFSGFPEPYFAQNLKILNIWRRNRVEKIIREDLRDLSRLPELSQVEMLASVLPEKVGSPLSIQSLREDLEVSFDTVKRWLKYLNELYYYFELRPWSKSVARSLKKEPKIYLFDWSEIESPGIRFENLIASHLLKACHFWTDTGEGLFELYYLRNKEKQEIDFIVIKDKRPWLCVESKWSDLSMNIKSIDKFQSSLRIPYIQVVYESGIYRASNDKLLMSAEYFLSGLP